MTPRILATVADELDLVRVLRERIEQINVSRRELSEESGLTESLAEKLLCLPPIKYFGPRSFWNIFESLGLAVQIIEDPAATARFAERMIKRSDNHVRRRTRALVMSGRIPWLINASNAQDMSVKGNQAKYASRSRRTKRIHRQIARQAALIRWERVKAAVCDEAPTQSCPAAAKP